LKGPIKYIAQLGRGQTLSSKRSMIAIRLAGFLPCFNHRDIEAGISSSKPIVAALKQKDGIIRLRDPLPAWCALISLVLGHNGVKAAP
jgi:hypothetical protein